MASAMSISGGGDPELKSRDELHATELEWVTFREDCDDTSPAGNLTDEYAEPFKLQLPMTDDDEEIFVITNIQWEITGLPAEGSTNNESWELTFGTTDPAELNDGLSRAYWGGHDKDEYIFQYQVARDKGEPITDELQTYQYVQTPHPGTGPAFPVAVPFGVIYGQLEVSFASSTEASSGATVYGRVEGYKVDVSEGTLLSLLRKYPR